MTHDQRPHFKISRESVSTRPTEFEGGGYSYHRADYQSHGRSLIRGIHSVAQRTKTTADRIKDRAFLEVRLAPEEKLKDRYKNLLNNARITILDMVNESIGYGVIQSDDIALLENRLQEYAESENHTGRSYFSFVEELRPIDFQEKISPKLREVISTEPQKQVFVTIESFSSLPREARENGFIEQLQVFLSTGNGAVISSYVHSSGSVVVEISALAMSIQKLAANFESVRHVETTPRIVLPRVESLNEAFQNVTVRPIQGDATVCIFDSGITSGNTFFDPYVLGTINAINSHGYDTYHGTFVASRIIYRDNLVDQLGVGVLVPCTKILDVRVFGTDAAGQSVGLNESELMGVVRQIVGDYHKDIKVYNLSLGFVDSTDHTTLDEFYVSRIAAELDELSKKYDVLFVVSAGNINSFRSKLQTVSYPDHFSDDSTRILPPSEAFLGLSVGSIVRRYEVGAMTEMDHPSPFSRRGPGFGGTRKPDLVVDGGNVTLSGHNDARIAASAFGENPGELAYNVGTSFAAPIISSYAAELFDRIPDASANLVKAQLIHFASHPQGLDTFPRNDKFEHVGFGIPNLDLCLESLRSKATYIYEGIVPQQTYVKIPFWVPSILATDASRHGGKKAKVRITLVWNPRTDRRKQTDYSLVHLWPNLFKVDASGNEVQVPLSGLEEISYKEKFYPVTRIEKQFQRGFAGGLWSLQLRMSHRWDIPEDYEQEFAVIISVEDPHNHLDVYGQIINEVNVQTLTRVR